MYEKLNKIEKIIFALLSMGLLIFYAYAAAIQPAASQYHRGVYVLCTFLMIVMIYPTGRGLLRMVDYALAAGIIGTCGYFMLNYEDLMFRAGIETQTDKIVSVIGVLIGMEMARRVIGNVFVIIGGVLMLYGVFGHYCPEPFSHPGNSFEDLCTLIFLKSDGMFGLVTNAIATYILLFVMFGAFLEKCGAYRFFIDFPIAAVGHRVGGPAKVAVISSALFGSISGSAIANTVSTGSFTIPMMKKAGFRPHIAGAIEPAASIGGMFMPPIMGAGVFIMSELTGVPYLELMKISIFPAIMYFFSVFVMIHYEAKIHDIKGIKSERTARDILMTEGYFILPLLIIVVAMVLGFSAGMSAVIGLISCIVISWIKSDTRMEFSDIVNASCTGAESNIKIGATVGVIGVIVSVLANSGFIFTFTDIMLIFADGNLAMTIILIALASLILGMGVPGTVAYLVTAVVSVPILTELGVNLIAAHMIVYWLSQDSNITPPVCIAAFAGATIAKANMWRTAMAAFKFAKFLYLGPFLFGYVPGFSMQGDWMDIAKCYVLITIATFAYSYLLSGAWLPGNRKKMATNNA